MENMDLVYNANTMPLSGEEELRKAQEKVLHNESLTLREKVLLGRDHPVKEIDGYKLRPDCVYRAVSKKMYERYVESGFIYGIDENDEYQEYEQNGQIFNNNRGVDWYLGGASLRYGEVIIECPALKEYFIPAYDNGCHLSYDPTVRHMKSSGFKNPVPMNMVRIIKYPKDMIHDEVDIGIKR